MLMSTGSMTVNTFLVRRAGTQGRWRVALMQYLTLPCLPSKEVTSVLGEGGAGRKVRPRDTQVGDPQRLWGMRDRRQSGGPPRKTIWSLSGPQIPSSGVPNLEGAADLGTLRDSPTILHPARLTVAAGS